MLIYPVLILVNLLLCRWLLTCSFTKSSDGDLVAAGGLDNCCSIFKCPVSEIEEESLPGKRLYAGTIHSKSSITISNHIYTYVDIVFNNMICYETAGKKVAKLSGHGGYMSSCPFLKGDDSKILTGCSDGIIRLWNVESGKKISDLKGHSKDISSIHVHDQNIFAASSYDGSCSLWDLRTSVVQHRYYGNGTNALSVNIHPSGTGIGVGFENGVVSYYDFRAMAELVKFSLVKNDVSSLKDDNGVSTAVRTSFTSAPNANTSRG